MKLTEQQILNEAEKQSDNRLNGHDVSAFLQGAKWVCEKLNINVIKKNKHCIKLDCNCVHRYNENKCGIDKCKY
jgi:hypothetical protein